MENSQASNPFQVLSSRVAEEIKDALAAMRASESAIQFELVVRELERIAQELEWVGSGA